MIRSLPRILVLAAGLLAPVVFAGGCDTRKAMEGSSTAAPTPAPADSSNQGAPAGAAAQRKRPDAGPPGGPDAGPRGAGSESRGAPPRDYR